MTLGNIVGGLLFTGMALYWTHRKKTVALAAPAPEMALAAHRVAT